MPLVFSYASTTAGVFISRKRPRGEEAVNKKDGIYIIENLNLAELSAARVFEFFFVCLSLKITGGTASPVRPLALVPGSPDLLWKPPLRARMRSGPEAGASGRRCLR